MACASALTFLRGRFYRLSDEQRRIGALARTEFLEAPAVDLGHVQIALRIHAHAVNVPEGAGPLPLAPPGVLVVPLDVELHDLRGDVVGGPETAIGRQIEHLRRGRIARAELGQELAVL